MARKRLSATAGLSLSVLLFAAMLLTACSDDGSGGGEPEATHSGSGGSEITAVVGNSELVVGSNRLLVGLVGEDNQRIAGEPGLEVSFRFSRQGEPRFEEDARFVWAIPDVTGFFVANVEFDQAGDWGLVAVLNRDGREETSLVREFAVRAEASAPNVGDPVPPSMNLTLADAADLRQISTDPAPDREFYRLTVADALELETPFIVVFATPAFCQTQFCGPVLENVKEVRLEFADRVNAIHIEPFELDAEGQLVLTTSEDGRPDIVPVSAIHEWKLETEPWVFVVNGQGVVTARFEGTVSTEELRDAVTEVLG